VRGIVRRAIDVPLIVPGGAIWPALGSADATPVESVGIGSGTARVPLGGVNA
jgi:hypothetical protein